MNKGINLLPSKQKQHASGKLFVQILRYTAVGFMFVVTVSSLVVFILKIQTPLTHLQSEEKILHANLSSLNTRKVKYFVLNDRLKNISSLISKRSHLEEVLNVLHAQIPGGVSLDSLRVDTTSLTLVASSPSLATLGTTLDKLVEVGTSQKLLKKITLDTLIFDSKRGVYTLTFRSTLL